MHSLTKTEVAAAPEHRADIEKATLRRAESQPALQQHIDRLHRVGRRKLKARQHVNPLASSHQQPVQLVDGWYRKAFADTTKPLHLDIGCAYGRFCLDMATADPTRNYLGLDIRWPVVAVALCKATERTLDNCHFISCNANVNLERILGDVIAAGGVVERVSVQFPDPHFKTRNKKKRVLKPELVETIQQFLSPGGTLFMQGDIHEVQREMRLITRKVGTGLQDLEANVDSWLSHNPMGIPTERELAVQAKGGDVYRCMFKKR
ncbi:guanine-N(7)--methyltransferase [Tribonema minus]|uniref:tRNA (guanine(46)-N(7))-methyltransferase n=1 Tax=Tribonema minus TaxID=303371 RepID=A0A835ZDY0_9STRA|nr:guanine-N(7)--methyltransferase [Tribonema minus]